MKKANSFKILPSGHKSLAKPPVKATAAAAAAVNDFGLVVLTNEDCTVHGINDAGDLLDLSAVATVTATSDSPSLVIGPPLTAGATPSTMYNEKAVPPPGTANIAVKLTANDGSYSFSLSYVDTVKADPTKPTGVSITRSNPVAN